MADNQEEVFACTDLGIKLHQMNKNKSEIEIDEQEFELLKKTLGQIKHPVLVMNAIYDTLGIERPKRA